MGHGSQQVTTKMIAKHGFAAAFIVTLCVIFSLSLLNLIEIPFADDLRFKAIATAIVICGLGSGRH
jgi:hypothetical protein